MKHLIVVIILFGSSLLFHSCNEVKIPENAKFQLTIKFINEDKMLPIENAKVIVEEVKKPILTRWQYHKIMESQTDSLGIVNLQLDLRKRYYIFLDRNNGFIGDIEFEAADWDNNQMMEILSKSDEK